MPAGREEQVVIPCSGGGLNAVLHVPSGSPRGRILFCYPLFEERKSAQRVLVECARVLCNDGIMVLRFDYRGCGDSSGEFEEFVPSDWIADIRTAAAFLAARAGQVRFGVLGLRLGANLAACAAPLEPAPDFNVFWEPIPSGRVYLDHEGRRKLLREMMTYGKGQGSRDLFAASLAKGEVLDLDAYPVTPAFATALRDMTFSSNIARIKGTMLVIHVTHDSKPAPGMSEVRDTITGAGQSFDIVQEEPFWNRIGLVACPNLIGKTREWIRSRLTDA